MFTHTHVVQLSLPNPKDGETYEEIHKKGMTVALSLLHDAELMIKHDSKEHTYQAIEPDHAKAVHVESLGTAFTVGLKTDQHQRCDLTEWNHFEVTEKIPLVLGMSKQIVFYTALRFNDDGMEALSDAGSSVTIHAKYVLGTSAEDSHCIQLTETTQTRSPALLTWYIKSTMGKTHEKVNSYFKERFVEKMRGKGWA